MVAAWTLVVLSEWAAAAKRAHWRLDAIAPPLEPDAADTTGPWDMPVVEATVVDAGPDPESKTIVTKLPADSAEPEDGRGAGAGADAPPPGPAAAPAAGRGGRRRSLGGVSFSRPPSRPRSSQFPAPSPAPHALRPAPALKLCCGFTAELYATGLKRPTALAFGPGGLLYATQESGEVVAVGRGSAKPRVLARGFETPLGLDVGRLDALRLGAGLRQPARRSRQAGGLAEGRSSRGCRSTGTSRTRSRSAPTAGSISAAARPATPARRRTAAAARSSPSARTGATCGSSRAACATRSGSSSTAPTLYVSDNARDDLGDDEPAETIVRIKPGADYGWPRLLGELEAAAAAAAPAAA